MQPKMYCVYASFVISLLWLYACIHCMYYCILAFNALTLLFGRQEAHPAYNN